MGIYKCMEEIEIVKRILTGKTCEHCVYFNERKTTYNMRVPEAYDYKEGEGFICEKRTYIEKSPYFTGRNDSCSHWM